MARVEYGAIITDIIGSIGGITFQHNRSGKIARLRPKTHKNPTSAQMDRQVKHSGILHDWQRLSGAQQGDWNDFADLHTKVNMFGDIKNLSGLNWYESINLSRNLIGLPSLITPPAYLLPCAVPSYTVTINQTKIEINLTAPFDTTDNVLVVRATGPIPNTTINFRGQWRFITYEDTGIINNIDITDLWKSIFTCTYPPSSNMLGINIGIILQTFRKISGIQSVGSISNNKYYYDNRGIGHWIIGTTFKVT